MIKIRAFIWDWIIWPLVFGPREVYRAFKELKDAADASLTENDLLEQIEKSSKELENFVSKIRAKIQGKGV